MYGAIASVDLRSDGNSYLSFQVNENAFNKSSDRVVSKTETLDGGVVVTDWGFDEGRKTISMIVDISFDDYELLVEFQEDNTNTFLFHYKNESYLVILKSVTKNAINGLKVATAIKMDVIRKVYGNGEYIAA